MNCYKSMWGPKIKKVYYTGNFDICSKLIHVENWPMSMQWICTNGDGDSTSILSAKKSKCCKFDWQKKKSQIWHLQQICSKLIIWINWLHRSICCVVTFLHLNIDTVSPPQLVPICSVDQFAAWTNLLYWSICCVVTFLHLNIGAWFSTPLVPIYSRH